MQSGASWHVIAVLVVAVASGAYGASFWHITDIHADDRYQHTGIAVSFCHTDAESTSQWYGRNQCGVPWRTVQSAVDFMRAQHHSPDFIVWTGDTAPYWPYPNWNHVFDKLRVVTGMLRHAFPNTPIYPAIGNHDAYPSDQLPDVNASFYNEYMRRSGWYDLLDNSARLTFARGGYYVASPSDQVRVIVLNTNLYYAKNQMADDVKDRSGQLTWLANTLHQLSELSNPPAVLVTGHIAAGFAHWDHRQPAINAEVNDQLVHALGVGNLDRRVGHVFGHEHIDTFKAARVENRHNLGFLVAPAIYPGSGPLNTNPGVRLYTFTADTAKLQDYQQFHMRLQAANAAHRSNNRSEPRDFWRETYRATRLYNIPDLSAASLLRLAHSMQHNSTVFNTYWRVSDGEYSPRPCDSHCFVRRGCIITSLTVRQMETCRPDNPMVEVASAEGAPNVGGFLQILSTAVVAVIAHSWLS